MKQGAKTGAKPGDWCGQPCFLFHTSFPLYFAFTHSLPFVCCLTAKEYKIITLQMCLECSRVCWCRDSDMDCSVPTTKQDLTHKGCSSPFPCTAKEEVRPLQAVLMLIICVLSFPLAFHQLHLIPEFGASQRIAVPMQECREVTGICMATFPRGTNSNPIPPGQHHDLWVLLCRASWAGPCPDIPCVHQYSKNFSPFSQLMPISFLRTENSIIIQDLSSVSAWFVKHDAHLSINFISLHSISLN